jgi:hypothetical protein
MSSVKIIEHYTEKINSQEAIEYHAESDAKIIFSCPAYTEVKYARKHNVLFNKFLYAYSEITLRIYNNPKQSEDEA